MAAGQTNDLDAVGLDALGLVAFHDPLRPSTIDTIARCRSAGIRVTLVTGDHLATARAVGIAAGLDPEPSVTGAQLALLSPGDRADSLRAASIVARVDPSTKVELVVAHQAAGEVVAMTGDGVNDAPALRQADIGVARPGPGRHLDRRGPGGRWGADVLGSNGALLAATFAGLADVHAVVIAVATLAAGRTLSVHTALVASGLALATNTASKCFVGFAAGGRAFGFPFTSVLAAPAAAVAIALLVALR